jgi:branched-chain amino acid transport system permease protein
VLSFALTRATDAMKRVPTSAWLVVLVAFLVMLPQIYPDQFFFRLLTTILIWSILGLGQNVITGFCGQLSFGHAAFYGIGAYTSLLLTQY